MVYPSQHPIHRVQSPLSFDVCLRAVRSILRQDKFQIVSEALFPKEPAIRILARVLDTKINQMFLKLSAQGSAHESVKQGGGTYRGIQYGSPKRGMPDLVLFDDPVTKTTLALALDGSPVCPEAVRNKIRESRQVFQEAQVVRDQSQLCDRSWDIPARAISGPV